MVGDKFILIRDMDQNPRILNTSEEIKENMNYVCDP